MLRFHKIYFLAAVALFAIEVLIALFLHDRFIRPFFGDYLVVFLVYCAVRSILDTPVTRTAVGVLIFAFAVEISQYFHLVQRLGLAHSRLALVVMGNQFQWGDLLAYTLGVGTILALEHLRRERAEPGSTLRSEN